MNEKIEKLFRLIKDFLDKKKSVQIRINLHQGDISEKVEVKESVKLEYLTTRKEEEWKS